MSSTRGSELQVVCDPLESEQSTASEDVRIAPFLCSDIMSVKEWLPIWWHFSFVAWSQAHARGLTQSRDFALQSESRGVKNSGTGVAPASNSEIGKGGVRREREGEGKRERRRGAQRRDHGARGRCGVEAASEEPDRRQAVAGGFCRSCFGIGKVHGTCVLMGVLRSCDLLSSTVELKTSQMLQVSRQCTVARLSKP